MRSCKSQMRMRRYITHPRKDRIGDNALQGRVVRCISRMMQLQTKTSDVSASLDQGTVMRNSGTRNDKAELFQEGHGLGIFVDILLETGEEGRNGLP